MTAHAATLVLHTPKGPEPCCDKHAAQLRGVMSLLGTHVFAVPAPEGTECNNCVNEAKNQEVA